MEIHLKVCFSFLVHLAIHISIAGADFSEPLVKSQLSACVGKDRSLDWIINNDGSINTVGWSFDGVAFALKAGSGGTPTYTGSTGIIAAKVEHTTSGKIVIKNTVVADSGEYSCLVTYTGGIASASSTATVAIVTAPSDPTLTITDDTYTCASDSTSVTVTIKVDNVDKGTNTFTVSDDSKVECCLSGYAVQCREDTSGTEYCKVLQTVTPPSTPPSDPKVPVPVIIGICVAVVVVIIIIISVCCCIHIRRKRNVAKEKQIHNSREDTNDYGMENNVKPTVQLEGAAVLEDIMLCDTATKSNDGLIENDNTIF